jgi:hypothetical protein
MTIEQCVAGICFMPLDAAAPKFFGFGEFLSALALLVLVWTTTDTRYRFRIATAVVPLQRWTFVAVAGVGTLTLLTDLWRAQEWMVPEGHLITPAVWQALMGALFLLTFLTWAWFAFLRPSTFGPHNAQQFGSLLLQKITEGSASDMAILAQELSRSIPALVQAAPSYPRHGRDENSAELTQLQGVAHEILLLIADPRFCRALIVSAPGTIHSLFQEITRTKKYGLPIDQLARNLVTAAIEYKDSFLYHEAEGYHSGLLGYWKPISQAMFADHRLVQSVDSLFDCDFRTREKWTAEEWIAYSRAVLTAVRSSVNADLRRQPHAIYRALDAIEHAASDLYKIDGMENGGWAEDSVQRLRASVDFCEEVMKILDEKGAPKHVRWRIRESDPHYYQSTYDQIVDVMFELIMQAASIKKPWDLCWSIQHNTVWGHFFTGLAHGGEGSKLVRFKLRRKIYDEIVSTEKWPNFQNTKFLGFCLNVMGLEVHKGDYGHDQRALQKAVLAWTKRNFVSLEAKAPKVFEHCLPTGLTYDRDAFRLVKTYQATAFRSEPDYLFFDLDKPPRLRGRKRKVL